MATERTRAIFTNALDVVHGLRNEQALTHHAKLSASVSITALEGRVVHVNGSGEFEMGCTGTQMAIFLKVSSDDPVSQVTYTDDDRQIIPAEELVGYVASGGFELRTTEFDKAQVYVPNQLLRAVADNANQTTGGRLTNQTITLNTNAVCGVVSGNAVKKDGFKQDCLHLWTVYQPGSGS